MRKILSALLACALLTGCATRGPDTTIDVTWAAPGLPPAKSFKRLLIITVASSEFVQEAFQKEMAAELTKQGVNAVASRAYFTRYTDAERARFARSIEESGADHVMLARVTTTASKAYEDRGTIIGPGGEPYGDASGIQGAYARYFYPGTVVSGADATVDTVTSETSIFAAKGEKLIWSARIRTNNAQRTTGAHYAPQYVDVILGAMKKDKLL
ncbi:MAG TPA: hypothetical protein VF110_14725 [Burkholderiales bacterium]